MKLKGAEFEMFEEFQERVDEANLVRLLRSSWNGSTSTGSRD
jgi:hypothetical protein